jgi:hypoxia up-regulated 1
VFYIFLQYIPNPIFLRSQKIAKNVNGDEAAVLGAAFRGATLSNQFRLNKQINIKDIIVYPIDIVYTPENNGKEGDDTL